MDLLTIAIDPGFDSIKVMANGVAFKIPFNVVETDERKRSDYAINDKFLLYRSTTSTSYRVGESAREIVSMSKGNGAIADSMDGFYTEKRFTSEEFSVGLDTAIALAIEKVNAYDRLHLMEIHVIVALPHSCREQFSGTIVGILAGTHKFTLRQGKSEDKSYDFTIKSQNVNTISQTIAAILGETSDDAGYEDEAKACYLTEGPTLVLDGGYYTFGMVAVLGGGSVDDEMTDSDTKHAMKNVNIAVADAIAPYRPDIQHYAMEYMLNKDGGKVQYLEDGKAKTLDLKSIKEEKIREVSASLVELLNKKYNNLLDFKYVIVTGGTGASFFKHLLKYYKGTGLFDCNHFLLTSSTFGGQQHDIEFAIAIGAYKGLMGIIG